MARRQRQRRRRDQRSSGPGPRPTQPHRDNVPGALDHASGVEEEFEAGIVAGAHGEPASDDVVAEEALEEDEALDGDDYEPGVDEEEASAGAVAGSPTANRPASGRGGLRAVGFLRASWAELQRVQWPDRRQVFQATAVVLGFVIVAGVYLGLADLVAQHVIDFIL